jgi:hypothetical protein
MASAWNMFVKKIYWEGKKKNKNFQFKEALKEASKRKSEMGSMSSSSMKKSSKKSKKMRGGNYGMTNMKMMGGKKSKKMRRGKSRKMRGGMNNASSSFSSTASEINGQDDGTMGGSIGVQMRAGNAN